MEEKERYKYYTETNQIYDSEEDELYAYNLNNNKIISILNQQDKRIKELEEENKFLEKRNEELTIDRRDFCLERNDLFEENQQLKQAQKQLAIEELKGLRDKVCDIGYDEDYNTDYFEVVREIDNQIKSLKGEE